MCFALLQAWLKVVLSAALSTFVHLIQPICGPQRNQFVGGMGVGSWGAGHGLPGCQALGTIQPQIHSEGQQEPWRVQGRHSLKETLCCRMQMIDNLKISLVNAQQVGLVSSACSLYMHIWSPLVFIAAKACP